MIVIELPYLLQKRPKRVLPQGQTHPNGIIPPQRALTAWELADVIFLIPRAALQAPPKARGPALDVDLNKSRKKGGCDSDSTTLPSLANAQNVFGLPQ